MGMDFKGTFLHLFWFVLFPFTCISYCLTPLTHDAQTFIGVERIADIYYPMPQGLDLAWEIKPIMNRFANWVLYKWGALTVGFDSMWFPVAVKALSLALVLVVCWYFSRKVSHWYTFPLVFTALTCIAPINILQAEYWAVLLSLVCIGLLVDDCWYHPIIAGFLFVVIGMFKGVTVLMVIPVLCAVYLLEHVDLTERFGGLYLGVMAGIGMFSVLSLTIWTHMVPDMLMSAQVAHVGFFSWWYVLTSALIWTAYYLPSTPLALFALLPALFLLLRLRWRDATAFAAMWLAPFAMVLIQGEFMIYHYFPMTIPAIVTLVVWERG